MYEALRYLSYLLIGFADIGIETPAPRFTPECQPKKLNNKTNSISYSLHFTLQPSYFIT